MERERASSSLHDQLLIAVERATQIQDESCVLIEQQRAVAAATRDTVKHIRRRRSAARARAAGPAGAGTTFGNGQHDARRR